MNEVLSRILESQSVVTPSGETLELHSHVSSGEGEFISQLIAESQCRTAIEIGLAYGISALFTCEALVKDASTKFVAIDPEQHNDWGGIGLYNLRRAGYDSILEFHEDKSLNVLPQLVAQGSRFDFAFIDGWHTFDYALVDFFYIDKMLDPGGIVCFDDTYMPALSKLCRFIATNLPYRVIGSYPAVARAKQDQSRRRKAVEALLSRPKPAAHLRRLIAAERLQPNRVLGIGGRCVAFMKTAVDSRAWNHHEYF